MPTQPKQLREQRRPLYVPAVLRPTEFPSQTGPMTPPKSLHGSLDSLDSRAGAEQNAHATHFDAAMLGGAWAASDDMGEVTGPPNKEHWKVRSQQGRDTQ